MRKRTENNSSGNFFTDEALISYYNIVKKTIQEYTQELANRCRYKSVVSQTGDGTVMDDRSRLIDLYDSCYIQNARLQSCCETLNSQLTGERYSLGTLDENGKFVRHPEESKKHKASSLKNLSKVQLRRNCMATLLLKYLRILSLKLGYFVR